MDMGGDSRYHQVSLSQLDALKLSYDEHRRYHDLVFKGSIVVPTGKKDRDGVQLTTEIEPWRAFSVWPVHCRADYDVEEPRYHLHPEFVDGEGKAAKATLCPNCNDAIKAGEIPEYSIASGVDFGDCRRLGLEPLTMRERQIISKVRHYHNIIKIESNTGKLREHTHSALKGCSILFDHDSPTVVRKLLSPESINGDVTIQFVGEDGEQYDQLIARSLGTANICARASVVYQWLSVLGRVNELYANDAELFALPPYGEFCDLINQCNRSIVENAKKTFVESNTCRQDDIARDDVARDDVARVRATSTLEVGRVSESKYQPLEGDEVEIIPERSCYVTSSDKTAFDKGTDSSFDFICGVAKTGNIDVKKEMKEYTAKSRRERDPFNEFDRKGEGLLLAFPDVFLLGKGYHNPSASLSRTQRVHLLHQYTTAAGSCRPLLFYLFDQLQRHQSIRGMHVKSLSDKESFDNFVSEYMSPQFQGRLRRAVKAPHSKDGKYVLKKLVPILASGGRKTVFGAVERYESRSQILALARRFGPAPAFLTFAIDDVNHPTAIRLALRSSNNSSFPCTVSAEASEAMKQGFRFEEGDVPIPTGWCERAKVLIGNPVGAALVYRNLVHDVLKILLGRQASNCSGDNRRTVKTDVDRWDSDSEPGIVGMTDAFFGKTETTGRGSLHFHVVLWTGISPELLEAAADLEDVCKIIGDVLDSQYNAELPRHCHVSNLATKCMRRYANDSETFSKFNTAARAMQLPPCPEETPAAFSAHVDKTQCTVGIHEHSFTCKKLYKASSVRLRLCEW
jgi:hypothetical protein